MKHLLLLFLLAATSFIATRATAEQAALQETGQDRTILQPGDYDAAYQAYSEGKFKLAFDEAMKRAQTGDPAAQTLLAILYQEGRAVKQDARQASYWFGRAAESGDTYAQLYYGIDLLNGTYVTQDIQQGKEYLRKAIAAGLPAAYRYYGMLAAQDAPANQRDDIALSWYMKGAAAGDSAAAYDASQILAQGTQMVARNNKAARTLLEVAANNGHSSAQVKLAEWMTEGIGGPVDRANAFSLATTAAHNHIPAAQILLANFYRNGIGTQADVIKASVWYLRAKAHNISEPGLETMLGNLSKDQFQEIFDENARIGF